MGARRNGRHIGRRGKLPDDQEVDGSVHGLQEQGQQHRDRKPEQQHRDRTRCKIIQFLTGRTGRNFIFIHYACLFS